MRPRHTHHPIPTFPVYSCAFLSDNQVVLGGGGGATRSGIKNKLRLYEVTDDHKVEQKVEFELEKGEDAPMSMAVHAESKTIICGVNSAEEKLLKGENENCRAFTVTGDSITPLRTRSTLTAGDLEDYQKVTVLSPDGSLLAVAGAHDLSLLSFPSLEPVASPVHTEKEIYDVAFGASSLVIATTHNLLVYELPTGLQSPVTEKGKAAVPNTENSVDLVVAKTIDVPSVIGEGCTFRSIRMHPTNPEVAFTLINTNPPRSRQKKMASRQGYAVKWNTKTWAFEKSRKIGDKGVTCFDISPDGRYLGFGSSDLSIGMVDASTLAPCATILKAHEFPPTVIKFNPSSTLLVSGSADNSIRIVNIPESTSGSGLLSPFLLAVIIIILAFLAQMYLKSASP
ncbi:quinon protein alcohol dehydrogenase-like superfamily [Coprinopsis sp. MPI-PUGE-AT-0042]|nr:quinon protein alcohol dehydrogenase-like superfamily [Coprinopsis sp. MPI-PUGE-AT-0042]